MKTLKQYIPKGCRHKLLFTSYHPEEIAFIDVGLLLAHEIESSIHDNHLPMIADDAIERIIQAHTVLDAEIGPVIALHNIGILFEPALKLDLHAKFNSWSKACAVIVDCIEGTIKNNVFYLADGTHQTYAIHLSDISYNIH